MINENENTQPELNMVSEESTAPVAEPQAEPQAEPVTETPVDSTNSTETPRTESATTEPTSTIKEDVGTYPSSVQPENNVQQTLQQTQQR